MKKLILIFGMICLFVGANGQNSLWTYVMQDPVASNDTILIWDNDSTKITTIEKLFTKLQDSLFHSRTATDSDSIDATDKGGKIYMNHADTDTLTLRTNATVPFPIETEITVINWGAGQTTIEAEGGVTIYSANGALNLRVQYSAATLIKQDTDTWLLVGDIE